MASERFFDSSEHEKTVSKVPENFFERSSYVNIYDYNFVLVASERITKLRKFWKILIFLKIFDFSMVASMLIWRLKYLKIFLRGPYDKLYTTVTSFQSHLSGSRKYENFDFFEIFWNIRCKINLKKWSLSIFFTKFQKHAKR